MGRYTTVQTFSDQDAQVATVAYDATVKEKEPSGTTSEIKDGKLHVNRVDNVSGSSAGAGSGEFHSYRAARRREMERVAVMEKRYNDKKAQQEFEAERKRKAEEFEAKMRKRTEKRKRRRKRGKAKNFDQEVVDMREKTMEEAPETPGGVTEIPNDGSFLEKMLALQQEKEKIN
ncbi:uncharacterized protein CCR75_002138 [Bremia lactucae]|uniref:Uncharacterized protein n=1 Tax=Bremia lactucae TaxID=4779 RepID=A0A976I9Y1_BRELC|nr:hypothetical protein CCR75_002138 [Bremia lactucae]